MIKIVSLFALMGVASAGVVAPAYSGLGYAHAQPLAHAYAQPLAYAQPIAKVHAPLAYAQPQLAVAKVHAVQPEPFDPHPQYNYGYSVSDGLTGDSKTASETRDGDVVKGQYSLVEPDGAIRTVTYTADDVNGFNAVVERSAPQVAVKAVHAPVVAKVHAAPALAYAHAPVHAVHAAPAYAHAGYAHGLAGPAVYHH